MSNKASTRDRTGVADPQRLNDTISIRCSLSTKRFEAWTGRLPLCTGSLIQWPLSHNRHCPRECQKPLSAASLPCWGVTKSEVIVSVTAAGPAVALGTLTSCTATLAFTGIDAVGTIRCSLPLPFLLVVRLSPVKIMVQGSASTNTLYSVLGKPCFTETSTCRVPLTSISSTANPTTSVAVATWAQSAS